MTFYTWSTTNAHRNLIRFDSDVAARVDARALDASTTRAYNRDCKQPPKRHDSACSHGAAVHSPASAVTMNKATGRSAAACINRNCFSRQMQTQWLARKCSDMLALVL